MRSKPTAGLLIPHMHSRHKPPRTTHKSHEIPVPNLLHREGKNRHVCDGVSGEGGGREGGGGVLHHFYSSKFLHQFSSPISPSIFFPQFPPSIFLTRFLRQFSSPNFPYQFSSSIFLTHQFSSPIFPTCYITPLPLHLSNHSSQQ